ncbi:hypothetical protein BKA69DRAFT_1056496 [Paraphysoderma sedebokerense]|nr:hypothetical protein BKA69DRAFT_1056496 [Paraphysoderma sedebokerense]
MLGKYNSTQQKPSRLTNSNNEKSRVSSNATNAHPTTYKSSTTTNLKATVPVVKTTLPILRTDTSARVTKPKSSVTSNFKRHGSTTDTSTKSQFQQNSSAVSSSSLSAYTKPTNSASTIRHSSSAQSQTKHGARSTQKAALRSPPFPLHTSSTSHPSSKKFRPSQMLLDLRSSDGSYEETASIFAPYAEEEPRTAEQDRDKHSENKLLATPVSTSQRSNRGNVDKASMHFPGQLYHNTEVQETLNNVYRQDGNREREIKVWESPNYYQANVYATPKDSECSSESSSVSLLNLRSPIKTLAMRIFEEPEPLPSLDCIKHDFDGQAFNLEHAQLTDQESDYVFGLIESDNSNSDSRPLDFSSSFDDDLDLDVNWSSESSDDYDRYRPPPPFQGSDDIHAVSQPFDMDIVSTKLHQFSINSKDLTSDVASSDEESSEDFLPKFSIHPPPHALRVPALRLSLVRTPPTISSPISDRSAASSANYTTDTSTTSTSSFCSSTVSSPDSSKIAMLVSDRTKSAFNPTESLWMNHFPASGSSMQKNLFNHCHFHLEGTTY